MNVECLIGISIMLESRLQPDLARRAVCPIPAGLHRLMKIECLIWALLRESRLQPVNGRQPAEAGTPNVRAGRRYMPFGHPPYPDYLFNVHKPRFQRVRYAVCGRPGRHPPAEAGTPGSLKCRLFARTQWNAVGETGSDRCSRNHVSHPDGRRTRRSASLPQKVYI
jgi:hypothetical protein